MRKRQPYYIKRIYPLVGLVLMIMFACARDANVVGIYGSTEKSPPEFSDIRVEFKDGGEGIRRFRGEETHFEWQVKGNEVRIQTKAGGIIVGKIQKGEIAFSLPGPKIVYLKKID